MKERGRVRRRRAQLLLIYSLFVKALQKNRSQTRSGVCFHDAAAPGLYTPSYIIDPRSRYTSLAPAVNNIAYCSFSVHTGTAGCGCVLYAQRRRRSSCQQWRLVSQRRATCPLRRVMARHISSTYSRRSPVEKSSFLRDYLELTPSREVGRGKRRNARRCQ